MRSTLAQHDLLAALPHLRRYAAVLTGDEREADRLVIETLELAREAAPPEAAGADLQTPLFALMHQLNGRRAATRSPAATGAAIAAPASEKPPGLLTRFRNLPSEEREILLLVAVERMRYDEIATLLHVPVSTIIARLKHARDLLRGVDFSSEQNEQTRS